MRVGVKVVWGVISGILGEVHGNAWGGAEEVQKVGRKYGNVWRVLGVLGLVWLWPRHDSLQQLGMQVAHKTLYRSWFLAMLNSVSGGEGGYVRLQVAHSTMSATTWDARGLWNSVPILVHSDSVTGGEVGTKIGTEFYEPLASQAVAGIALCATCHLTYPALLSIMFGHLPPSPPLTASLGTTIGTGFYEPLASQAVAGIVLCATCNLTYPALLSIMFGHLPPSPPLTELLGTKIGTEFYEPLASQAVAGIVLCATCNLTYPALLLIIFGHLPPLPPLTASLGTKIGTEFYEPLASQAVADIALCATCDVAYLPLLLIIFGHLPPLPPLTASLGTTIVTESLGTKISTEFYEPLASQAVAGIALCANCNLTYPALLSIMFGHLPPSPPLTASLGTTIGTGFYEPLASQAVAGIVLCAVATCHILLYC
ncbi:hypothetical protein F5876DRAFT_69297 [Lentinula aff. lateritia]|uniref:Uncharacterized protein n=1 Tax=Lentinula aff. lateritia TaxID=2804960 RepID=A0ACC1TN49_9AGAR|nr:hypothetical protein F5876DRAFT_69297 [Lentinula aff. lateritia]